MRVRIEYSNLKENRVIYEDKGVGHWLTTSEEKVETSQRNFRVRNRRKNEKKIKNCLAVGKR